MFSVITMASFMHCCERLRAKALSGWLLAFLLIASTLVHAQTPAVQEPMLRLQRTDDAVLLSAQVNVELPAVVEDALLKGIPIYFVMTAKLVRERWYWSNQILAMAQRHTRLSYHPLTRRWRISTAAGGQIDYNRGISLDRNFESLQDALAAVRRVAGWRIAEGVILPPENRYLVDFMFELDVSQLPRPLQIGTLGQSDWQISVASVQALAPFVAP